MTTNADDPTYLATLPAVRDRCHAVLAAARAGKTLAFTLDEPKLADVADMVTGLIKRDYAKPTDVPPHSRWRHYEMHGTDRLQALLDSWAAAHVDKTEQARRILDLIIVSVLLDAGAGNDWKFVEADSGRTYSRSEGLALAALDMFKCGAFSSDPANKHQADAEGLRRLTAEKLAAGFQVATANPLVGLDGRTNLLRRLGDVISESTFFKGAHVARPGNIVDYLAARVGSSGTAEVSDLWLAVQSLKPMWPSRATLSGVALGDVWPCSCLPAGSHHVPFHKLSQWLTYSLLEPLTRVLGWHVKGKELLTGLAEYRNGGLFVDLGVLTLTPAALARATISGQEGDVERVPLFTPDDVAVVEWRALTVALLDRVGDLVRERVCMSASELELAKVLEGGTWKAGREIAAKLRPVTKGPPINLISDGTVF